MNIPELTPEEIAFDVAVAANDLAKITGYLDTGINVNRKNVHGLTPLMVAAGRGYLQLMEILLTAGADVHVLDSRMGASALHKAAQQGLVDGACLLLGAGAFIDLRSAVLGHSSLMDAVWMKQLDMVEFLLDRDANTALTTNYGASLNDFLGISSGAPSVSDSPEQEKLMARMRELVVIRETRDRQRMEANHLMLAVRSRNLTAVQTELSKGNYVDERFPVTGTADDGTTPLIAASLAGETEIVEALLRAGANPRLVDRIMKATPGHKAAYRGHAAVLQILIEAGLELNAQGPYNGYTALHDATWHGHTEAVKVLLAAGASPQLVAQNGKTPLDLAQEYGYQEIVNLLKAPLDR